MCDNHDVGKGIYGLQILVYVCSLLKITRPHIKNPLVYAAKASKRKCDKLLLKIQKLSLKAFKSKIKAGGLLYDLNSVILVSPKTALHLSARNGQWLYASTYIKHSQKKDKQKTCVAERWIELCICPNVPDDCCNISPILYHNLIQSNYDEELVIEFTNDMKYFLSSAFQKMIVLWQNCHKTELFSEEEVKFESGPQYAAEVHIKYVESLQYKCGTQLDALINDYFSIPKALTLNDILLIPIPNHLEHEFANNNSIVPPRYIFIEICSVKGKTGNEIHQTVLLSKGATNLYLGGATRRPFPCLSEVVNSKGEISVPPILAKNVENLASDFRNDFNFIQEEKDQCNKEMQICKSCEQKCELGDLLISKKTSEKDLNSMKFESKDIVRPSVLYLAPPGSGAEEIISIAASRLGLEVVWIDCWHLKGDTSGATEGRLRQSFHRASVQSPCVLALLNVHCLAKDNDGNDDSRVVAVLKEEVLKLHNLNVFLVATAPDSSKVSADLWSIWSHQETIEVPDLVVRSHMLDWLFSHWITKAQIQIIAQRTAGCVYGDFQALLAAAKRVCLHRLSHEQEVKPSKDISCNHSDILPISFEDVLEALNELQSSRSEALGAPRIPQVQWKDVGGLEDAKREVVNTIQLPLRHPSLVSSGLRRSGVLLYGPPGTGKTLLAKAVATECGLNFMSVKGPELLNMYVGQSEENVRQVFARARTAAPCVIFFDELDSLAPNRGHSGDSGGVMDRIVSALLVELDGAASSSDVFVLAATNRPDLLDPALLRPGRFEKLVFLGACDDRDAQVKILQAVTSKVPLAEDIDLTNVADMLPSALTGADLYALCSDALYVALERTTDCIMSGMLDEQDADVLIQENDFRVAANQLVPSVSVQELVHYRNMSTNERSRRE